ncbi:MAG: UDP-N-acetylmuramoyl-L-alanine--D-glutamate ligase [Pseudomonadota bacterium]
MIEIDVTRDQTVALFGLGGSGLVTAAALMAGGTTVVAFDDNPTSVERAEAQGIPCADLRTIDWDNVDALILAPGVPLTHPQPHWTVEFARRSEVPVVGDVELFFRQMAKAGRPAPVIAITGTNGKSTTTALIAHVLKAAGRDVQMGGNIGRAVLDLDPLSDTPANQVYVVEISSYQIDLAPSLAPHVGLLLNITPDHLERHGTLENYAAIKERLVAASDLAIVGVDDEHCRAISGRLTASRTPLVTISKDGAADVAFVDGKLLSDRETVADLSGIGSLRGHHNGQNAAAAFAACRAVGLADEDIQSGLETFPGLAHRMEQAGHVGEVLFVNDSKATNAEAAAPALSSFDKVHWIAGGLAKDGGIASLGPQFERIAKAYFIGEAAGSFASQLPDTIPYEIAGNLKQAVNHAARDAALAAGQGVDAVVLLSPAAASFDQFPNFEKRGEAFKDAVAALEGYVPIGG